MSHFSVAVFMNDDNQDLDALLAPYDQQLEVKPYKYDGELTTYNPDSQWDWYCVGGRWQGMLKLKPKKKGIRGRVPYGEKISKGYDGAFARDIDFELMRKQSLSELQPYEKAMKESFYKESFMRRRYPNEKDYIKRCTNFSTYAVVTPDGEWHAPSKFGWLATFAKNMKAERNWELDYYDNFIKPSLKNNWYMIIADCHI